MLNKNSLSAAEICAIIDKCGESRVAELSFGDLRVVFARTGETPDPEPRAVAQEQAPVSRAQVGIPLAPATEIAAIQKEQANKGHEEDELAVRQDQIAHLLVEDPVMAEELLIKGELSTDAGAQD